MGRSGAQAWAPLDARLAAALQVGTVAPEAQTTAVAATGHLGARARTGSQAETRGRAVPFPTAAWLAVARSQYPPTPPACFESGRPHFLPGERPGYHRAFQFLT